MDDFLKWLDGNQGILIVDFIKDVAIPFIGTLFALLALGLSAWEYRKAQRWKRSEFASQQLDLLNNDPLLKFCCIVLDWRARNVVLPSGYEHLAKPPISEGKIVITHSESALMRGLKVISIQKDNTVELDMRDVFYRDAFDRFFGYLEFIENYIEVQLIDELDVNILGYWLQKLDKPAFYERREEIRNTYKDYINTYHSPKVIRLMKRFGIDFS